VKMEEAKVSFIYENDDALVCKELHADYLPHVLEAFRDFLVRSGYLYVQGVNVWTDHNDVFSSDMSNEVE